MRLHASCHHVAYRLTCEDFDKLWKRARGCCQICRTPAEETTRGKLEIDHAGQYGIYAVRGLLCSQCNQLMAYVDRGEKSDPRASNYLRNAWFVQVLEQRHEANVRNRREVPSG
ncbi:endonuclease domain-containing protein [Amycolatopsis japonica]